MTTIAQALTNGRNQLHDCGIQNAKAEAEWLLAEALGMSRAEMLLTVSAPVSGLASKRFEQMLQRRCRHEPLQYILASTEFYGRNFAVGPGVLIPRPETEQLTELAIARYPGRGPVCDLCTGSGAIAITLALELPDHPPVIGIDISPEALFYARQNRDVLGADNLQFIRGNLLTPLASYQRFAMITVNPPYVDRDEYDRLPNDVRQEPALALVADDDGLAIIRKIAAQAYRHMPTGGWLICEIGETQGGAVLDILSSQPYTSAEILKDLCGRDRFAVAQARQ